MTTRQRAQLFLDEKGICYLCGGKIDLLKERWEHEHEIALDLGGLDEPSNWRLAHYKCHKAKTTGDIKQIAKGRRIRLKDSGTVRSRHPLPGGRGSKWKRKLSGQWVRREED